MSGSTAIADQADKYLGKPFVLGDVTKGFDCISLILDFFGSFGFKFPEEFEGLTRENYAKEWLLHPEETSAKRKRFFLSLGQTIDKKYFKRGDLLLFENGTEFFCGIDLGNGNIKLLFFQGVHNAPYHLFKRWHIASRRLI